MQILLFFLGTSLLILVTLDILVTTLTMRGGGILTSRLSTWIWQIALRIHYRHKNHKLLLVTSWAILMSIALSWYFLFWIGWSLVFISSDSAVVKGPENNTPAGIWERIYFVGYTISTLGLGKYIPSNPFWQILTAIASMTGFALITVTFAYLLPVVSAAANARKVAMYITSLGGTADDILIRAWTGQDFGKLDQHLINLSPMVIQAAENHLTYPILHFFHSLDRARSIAQSIVALDEALTLLQYGVKPPHRPDHTVLNSIRRAIAIYLKTLRSAYLKPSIQNPPHPPLEQLRKAEIPTVSDLEFSQAIKPIYQRRRLLLAMLENDGWTWDNIASLQTTNRGHNLDDETSAT